MRPPGYVPSGLPLTTNLWLNGDYVQTPVLIDPPGIPDATSPDDSFYADQMRLEVRRQHGDKRSFTIWSFPGRERSGTQLSPNGVRCSFGGFGANAACGSDLRFLRRADVVAPNLMLCGGQLVVHVIDQVLIPYQGLLPSYLSIIASTPKLSTTYEACLLVPWACDGNFFTGPPPSLLIDPAFPFAGGTSGGERSLIYNLDPTLRRGTSNSIGNDDGVQEIWTGYCKSRGQSLNQPPGSISLGLARLGISIPGSSVGSTNGPIPGLYMSTFLAPTDAAWKVLFAKLAITKEQLFNDPFILGEFLMYHQIVPTWTFTAQVPGDLENLNLFLANCQFGQVPTTNYFQGAVWATQLGQYLGGGIPCVEDTRLNLQVEVRGKGDDRQIVFLPEFNRQFDRIGNAALVVEKDLYACNGVVQVVDSVLIPPTFSTYERIRLNPLLSKFRALLEVFEFVAAPPQGGRAVYVGLLQGSENTGYIYDCCPNRFVTGNTNPNLAGVADCTDTQLLFLDGRTTAVLDRFVQIRPGQAVRGVCWDATVFAPTNKAIDRTIAYLGFSFASLRANTIQAWAYRTQLVLYHTVVNSLPFLGIAALLTVNDVVGEATYSMIDGEALYTFILPWGQLAWARQAVQGQLIQASPRQTPCFRRTGGVLFGGTQGFGSGSLFLGAFVEKLYVRRYTRPTSWLGASDDRVYVLGDINGFKIVWPRNELAANGFVHTVNAALIPPLLAVPLFFRITHTPSLSIMAELIRILGLEYDLTHYFYNAFLPSDAAILRLLKQRGLTYADVGKGARCQWYDFVVQHLNVGFRNGTSFRSGNFDDPNSDPVPGQRNDFAFRQRVTYGMIYPGRRFITPLYYYWGEPKGPPPSSLDFAFAAEKGLGILRASRFDTRALPLTPLLASKTAYGAQVLTTVVMQGPRNGARIVAPLSQNATNGVLHILDNALLLPGPRVPTCTPGRFEYFGETGQAFSYSERAHPRDFAFVPCYTGLKTSSATGDTVTGPSRCTYVFCRLFEQLGTIFRPSSIISVEAEVTYTGAIGCSVVCPPGSGWLCLPCSGVTSQTIVTIGGCALGNPQCGGSLVLYVNDMGEVRWGVQTYAYSFFIGTNGLRIISSTILAKGFIARPGKRFKVLVTYDAVCDFARIWIDGKLRGQGELALPDLRRFADDNILNDNIGFFEGRGFTRVRAKVVNATSFTPGTALTVIGLTQRRITVGDGMHALTSRIVPCTAETLSRGPPRCPDLRGGDECRGSTVQIGIQSEDLDAADTNEARKQNAVAIERAASQGQLGASSYGTGIGAVAYGPWQGIIHRLAVWTLPTTRYPTCCRYPPPGFLEATRGTG